jgi:serine/threonine protein kinase
VVKFLEPIRIGDDVYMAMECCDGGSLTATVFYDGLGQLAQQTRMDPKVELALKLSYMTDMLVPLSYIGENRHTNHHDVKAGNFFLRGDGSIALADFGTASSGKKSNNFVPVENPEQHSPESMTSSGNGPPYTEVDHKSDSFAFGVMLSNFALKHDLYDGFNFNAPKGDMLKALYEHRDGFFMPPKPQPPNPLVGQPHRQYLKDVENYDKMEKQKALLETAGFKIGNDGAISLFKDDGNPLKQLVNEMLHPDPAKRGTAATALLSEPMQALSDPELQKNLQELRALIPQLKVVKDDPPKHQQFTLTPEQQTKFNTLTAKISELLANDTSGIWESMGV